MVPAGNAAAGLKTFVVKNKLWLVVAAVALVVVIAVTLMVSSLGKRLDMSRYPKVEATGYNGYGRLDYDDYDLDDLEELMCSAAEAARRAAELEQINKGDHGQVRDAGRQGFLPSLER